MPFSPGDRVRTSLIDPPHHTRLPRYARGRIGTVVELEGTWALADVNATGRGDARPVGGGSVRQPGIKLAVDVAGRDQPAFFQESLQGAHLTRKHRVRVLAIRMVTAHGASSR